MQKPSATNNQENTPDENTPFELIEKKRLVS